MGHFKQYPLDFKTSKIVVAVAQLTGPLPYGKHKTVISDRETLGWKSLEDMNARIDKACGVLTELAKVPLKPQIVVFPEYSFPVQQALERLQTQSDAHDFIVIGGADSISQSNSNQILNQTPIIIPHRKPIWNTKRVVSKWEEGLIDEPADGERPILTWNVGSRKYWISVHICLDFSLAPDEFKDGGGVFIVPMCSPDIMSFLGWADGLLRLTDGTATVLCNCVGEGANGQSGVVAVNPDGKPFQAAFELSTTQQQVALFEIDLQHLSPPKKSPLKHNYPLGRRFIFEVQMLPEGVQLPELPPRYEGIRKRGVINPAIFYDVLGKKMRMAFLNVPQYAEIERNVRKKEYEVLSILGREDLMVTHLAADRYDMIFDVTQAITWIGVKGNTVTSQDLLRDVDEENFPHFSVEAYYKVLGMPVSESDRGIFTGIGNPFPNLEEIAQIFKLGQFWEDPDISDEDRTKFLESRWILGTTDASPGDINAVMTVRLEHAKTENKSHLLTRFEEEVLPDLLDNPQVTSLYRGISPGLGIDYVLRLSLNLDKGFERLYELIQRIHRLSVAERLMVDSTTYIVVATLAKLSLPKAVLVTNLPRELKLYRDRRVCPYLSVEERMKLIYLPEKEQVELINQFRPIDEALEDIRYLELDAEEKMFLLRRLTRGLFNKNFDYLREVHDPLQMKVEKMLTAFIKERVSKEKFRELKSNENIAAQKSLLQLSYTEKIKVATSYLENNGNQALFLGPVRSLNLTSRVRNAFFHNDSERLSIDECIMTLVDYCKFIMAWQVLSQKEQNVEK